jgi:glycerol kinase
MGKTHILAFDASTTAASAIVFGPDGHAKASASEEIRQYYPTPGWVEHDPLEIWEKQRRVARSALERAGVTASDIAGIGITNQRETSVIWDRATGAPIGPAIVWQDRRTADYCTAMSAQLADVVARNTGLIVDAYFSASKIVWLLDNIPGARARAERGDLAFGTIDSWLVWNLTGGRSHVTDCTNASRTLLYNIRTRAWDDDLLRAFGVPASLLPEVRDSAAEFGVAAAAHLGGEVPILSAVGDQQASLFGQACFDPGMTKCSYGTSAAIMMNTGSAQPLPARGLVTTLAATAGGPAQYAVEGVVFNSGAAVQWLRDELQIIATSADAVVTTPDTNGVYFVPAFTGLLAPVWDPYARGAIVGLTRGANRAHIIRATLEALAYQVHDLAAAIGDVADLPLKGLRADGGSSRNDFVMQFQADISGVPITRSAETQSAARGAAFLAGLAAGVWRDLGTLADTYSADRTFHPAMDRETAAASLREWRKAVERSLDWARQR